MSRVLESLKILSKYTFTDNEFEFHSFTHCSKKDITQEELKEFREAKKYLKDLYDDNYRYKEAIERILELIVIEEEGE